MKEITYVSFGDSIPFRRAGSYLGIFSMVIVIMGALAALFIDTAHRKPRASAMATA